jgi:hypothetical protein
MTDFDCNDKDTIGHKHKLAYTIVKDEVADLLKGYEIDEATSSVSQPAYYLMTIMHISINQERN